MLVSDYGGGLVTPRWSPRIKRGGADAAGAGRRSSSIRATTSPAIAASPPSTPNEAEVEALLGVAIDDDPAALERAGRALLERTADGRRADHARQPRHGAVRAGQADRHIPIYGSDEIADVTGAGDTVIATMTLALAAGASLSRRRSSPTTPAGSS